MPMTLTIRDEELTGKTVNELSLEFLTERITVQELIRSRVYQEVKDHNAGNNRTEYRGLVQPTDTEQTLNGYRLKTPRTIDWRKQFNRAIEAFEKNQVLILVNERQVESLDDEIEVRPDTSVSFLRLTLLVGG
jgi:hypothetical protein